MNMKQRFFKPELAGYPDEPLQPDNAALWGEPLADGWQALAAVNQPGDFAVDGEFGLGVEQMTEELLRRALAARAGVRLEQAVQTAVQAAQAADLTVRTEQDVCENQAADEQPASRTDGSAGAVRLGEPGVTAPVMSRAELLPGADVAGSAAPLWGAQAEISAAMAGSAAFAAAEALPLLGAEASAPVEVFSGGASYAEPAVNLSGEGLATPGERAAAGGGEAALSAAASPGVMVRSGGVLLSPLEKARGASAEVVPGSGGGFISDSGAGWSDDDLERLCGLVADRLTQEILIYLQSRPI